MLVKGFLVGPYKHLRALAKSPEYRAWCALHSRYGRSPRYQERRIRFDGMTWRAPDAASFLSTVHDIYVSKVYDVPFERSDPRILDLGANIGLSIAYQKRRHPEAQVLALEADPGIFGYLEANMAAAGFPGLDLRCAAAWDRDGVVELAADGADGGRCGEAGADATERVRAVDVRSLVAERDLDFLKVDIEGAETRVLPALDGALRSIRYVFVEFHSRVGERQDLGPLLALLQDNGFRVHLYPVMATASPWGGRPQQMGFDMQLNVYAWQDG